MSMKAYSSYTLIDVVDGLQWQPDATSHPANPKEGWAYYNTVEKQSYLYDGTKWVVFAKDGDGAPLVNITPSSLYFKSTTGQNGTFTPEYIYIYPRFQNATYSSWQYSTDGGVTWSSVTGANGLSVGTYSGITNALRISRSSTLYTDTITSISFRCNTTNIAVYDVVSVAKIYDVVDLQVGGTNLIKKSDFMYEFNKDSDHGTQSSPSLISGYNIQDLVNKTITFSYYVDCPGDRTPDPSRAGTGTENMFGMHLWLNWRRTEPEADGKYKTVTSAVWPSPGVLNTAINTRPKKTATLSTPNEDYPILQSFQIVCAPYAKPASNNDATWKIGRPQLEIGNAASDWSPATEDVVDSASSINILVSNESHLFEANSDGTPLGETIEIELTGLKGTKQVATQVGTITGVPSSGMTTKIVNNNETNTKIQISVTSALTSVDSGVLTIPITVDGHTINKKFSWAKSKAGADGNGISDEFTQYCMHTSDVTPPSNSATWVDAFPESWDGKTYIWKRTKKVWTQTNEDGEYITTYTSPQLANMLDMATIAAQKSGKTLAKWCADNNVSIIDGSTIATGSITAKQINVNNLVADREFSVLIDSSTEIANYLEDGDQEFTNKVGATQAEYLSLPFDLTPIFEKYGVDQKYTLSFDLCSKNTTNNSTISVYPNPGNPANHKYQFPRTSFTVTTEYARYSITFTPKLVTNRASDTTKISVYGTYNTGNIPRIKNIKLELGDTATPWASSYYGKNLLKDTDFGGSNKKYTLPDGRNGEGGLYFNLSKPVIEGNQVALKFDIRGAANVNIYWMMKNTSVNPETNGNVSTPAILKDTISATAFKTIQTTYTIPSNRRLEQVYICTAYGNSEVNDWFEIKDKSLKLEIGNMHTKWTAAPEDMATKTELTVVEGKIESKVSNSEFSATVTQLNNLISSKVESSTYETGLQLLEDNMVAKVHKKTTGESCSWNITPTEFKVATTKNGTEESITVNSSGLNVTGTITARAGDIGGCAIEDGTLKVGNANITERLTADKIDVTNLKVGSANITDINIGSGTFSVDSSGNLIATSATLTGSVSADKGFKCSIANDGSGRNGYIELVTNSGDWASYSSYGWSVKWSLYTPSFHADNIYISNLNGCNVLGSLKSNSHTGGNVQIKVQTNNTVTRWLRFDNGILTGASDSKYDTAIYGDISGATFG